MDTSLEIKERYAKEAAGYRKDAWLVNFDAEELFKEFKNIVEKLYTDNMAELNILDLGAGNGMLTELVMSLFPNARVTMLDFSPEMLESSEAYFEKLNISLDNVEFTVKNFVTDDFPNQKYDLVISSFALHHVRTANDLENVYLKIVKSLKDNGSFINIDYYLEEDEESRKRQTELALENWTKNFSSRDIAEEWGDIIKGEDSPATIALIISLMNKCEGVVPFLYPNKGVMATIYGMSKLGLDKLKELGLSQYVEETKKYLDKEKIIGRYTFDY